MGSESRATTVVLLGRTGNGKSATGNSLLGWEAFKSRRSSKGVTDTCKMEQAVLDDGRILNVVDTPGLFDTNMRADYIGKEIVKCMEFAKEGLHGVLLVLSVRSRFTAEEASALEELQKFFGEKFVNYMVVVFTGGDELEADEQTLEDYLNDIPLELQKLLHECNHRTVLFNNKTRSETHKGKQAAELLKQIDNVMVENAGQPYSNQLFREAQAREESLRSLKDHIASSNAKNKEEIENLKRQFEKERAEQREFTKMVEEKARLSMENMQNQLAAAAKEREAADLRTQLAQAKADEEIRNLQLKLQAANNQTGSRGRRRGICGIM
eukprot:Gb_00932 [translate_table: standard]